MAALDRLFSEVSGDELPGGVFRTSDVDDGSADASTSALRHRPPALLPLAPMLEAPDEPRLEQRPHRRLATNELDGPDYDDAVAAGDAEALEHERVLYGTSHQTQQGWPDEKRAA